MSQRPTVSVCILCYNQAHLIASNVRAALAQTRPADEVLVVDDGSMDGSTEVLREFPEIRVFVHPENRGRAAARNTLLQAASGEIVLFLDGDVVAEANVVEKLLGEYHEPRVGAVGGRAVDPGGSGVANRWRQRHVAQELPEWTDRANNLFGSCFSGRTELLKEAGGWRPGAEECDLGHRLRAAGYSLVFTPEAVVQHMRDDNLLSLMELNWRWWAGGYVARRRNNLPTMLPFLQYATWELVQHLRSDVRTDRDLALVAIDVAAYVVRVAAIVRAALWRESSLPGHW
jgi:biofilm PGA synthesis N-glycosyltransferase PgaC